MLRFNSAALVGVAAIVLVACSSASPGASSSSQPTAEPTATPVAQSSANAPTPSAGVVADLEALIPNTIAGITMTKVSMTGSAMIASGTSDATTQKFLQELGVSPDKIAIAFGTGFSADSSTAAVMFAFQATGAGRDKLLQVFKESMDASRDTPMVWETKSIGGKDAQVATETGQSIYLYATNDVLFMLTVTDDSAAAAVIASLP